MLEFVRTKEHFSHYSATCSGLISILSGVLQLLLAAEELLRPQRDSLTETSVITPVEVFRAYGSWGAGFPRLELSRLQRYANSATCLGLCSLQPSTKCKPRRKSIISQCTCSEIKLDHLQEPVSSVWLFHGLSQET